MRSHNSFRNRQQSQLADSADSHHEREIRNPKEIPMDKKDKRHASGTCFSSLDLELLSDFVLRISISHAAAANAAARLGK
jgi:hypothetical protein